MQKNNVIEVDKVAKKFCKNVGTTIKYGLIDITKNILGIDNVFSLRPFEFWALKDISFSIKKGEFVGLIGENGSGKSTLLKLINGIFMPDQGTISIRGKVGALISVGAGFNLFLTGRENIYINGTILGMTRKDIKEKFNSITKFADIGNFLDMPVKNYSSGMYVRLGFSIAIHSHPDILLIDEILSVGDLEFRKKAIKKLLEMQKKGVTVIFVSHNMQTITSFTKRSIYLNNGKIDAIGPTEKIISLYQSQKKEKNIKKEKLVMFSGKTILITGGTGFLGIALTKEILKHNPHSIRLFSRDEVKHYKTQELFNDNPKIRHFIGDVRDYPRLIRAIRNVDYVIHAAALKRIDLIEYNVEEVIKTNIQGTLNVVNACLEQKVKKAVFVSSDKACSPVNTYGSSKFMGERIFSQANYSKGDLKTIFTIVRYGNVLESTGSVIPFFTERILNHQDIPLTNSQMTRFIIAPKKAVDLIFTAIKEAKGGEIFVPKLKSFKIIDLIEVLKEKYQANNKVKLIGIRPGEKIHELLINEAELPRVTMVDNYYKINSCIEKSVSKQKQILNKEYSSKDNLISKTEVSKIFKELGLL